MFKRKSIYSMILAGGLVASMAGGIFADEKDLIGDGSNPIDHVIDVTGKVGPWQGTPVDPELPDITPPNVAQISVSVPIAMGFQVASNVIDNNGNPTVEFLTANYTITNHSTNTPVDVGVKEFSAKGGNGFEVIQAAPTKGNKKVEMNLDLVYGTNKVALYDNFATTTILGTLAPVSSENMTFDSNKYEVPNDEGQSQTLKSKHDLKLVVSVNP